MILIVDSESSEVLQPRKCSFNNLPWRFDALLSKSRHESETFIANHVSAAAFYKWLQQYNEGGLKVSLLARTDEKIREVLSECI